MSSDDPRLPLALLAATSIWCLGFALVGAQDALLFFMPALLLALPLTIRRYPGETTLLAIVSPRVPRARGDAVVGVPNAFGLLRLTGALLLTGSLSRRGPPLRPDRT